jgi:uncharacterized membrane protein HdeD (DUF308 family)
MTGIPPTVDAGPVPASDDAALSGRGVVSRDDSSGWQVVFVSGIVSTLFGVVILAWPEASLRVVAVFVGIWLLVGGIARVLAVFNSSLSFGWRVLSVIVGVVLIIAGTACLRDLVKALNLLAFIVALSWVFSGLTAVVMAFEVHGGKRLGLLLVGAASGVIGFIFLAVPSLSLVTLVVTTGVGALVVGAIELVVAFQLRRTRAAL